MTSYYKTTNPTSANQYTTHRSWWVSRRQWERGELAEQDSLWKSSFEKKKNTEADLAKDKNKTSQVNTNTYKAKDKTEIALFPINIHSTDKLCLCSHLCIKCLWKTTTFKCVGPHTFLNNSAHIPTSFTHNTQNYIDKWQPSYFNWFCSTNSEWL